MALMTSMYATPYTMVILLPVNRGEATVSATSGMGGRNTCCLLADTCRPIPRTNGRKHSRQIASRAVQTGLATYMYAAANIMEVGIPAKRGMEILHVILDGAESNDLLPIWNT